MHTEPYGRVGLEPANRGAEPKNRKSGTMFSELMDQLDKNVTLLEEQVVRAGNRLEPFMNPPCEKPQAECALQPANYPDAIQRMACLSERIIRASNSLCGVLDRAEI